MMANQSPTQTLRDRMKESGIVIGTWNLLDDPDAVEIMCNAGMDYIIHDMEHGTHSLHNIKNIVRAAHTQDAAALVRPPGIDFGLIQRVLDAGCDGLMVPNIQSVADAAAVIDAALYPPEGNRGLSPYTRGMGYDGKNVGARMQARNSACFIGLLIEGHSGIASLSDILDQYGDQIDVIYIGLYDLAKQINSTDDLMSEQMQAHIKDIIQQADKMGVGVGMLANTPDMVGFAKQHGVQFIAFKNDTAILHGAVESIVKACQ